MLEEERCVYINLSYKNFVILTLYVDDILLTISDNIIVAGTKKLGIFLFEMKYVGETISYLEPK